MVAQIEIDVCADVEAAGISRSLYLGEGACEPAFEDVESWEEIVERNIGYYVNPLTNKIRQGDMEELQERIAGLEYAITLFKKAMEEYGEK